VAEKLNEDGYQSDRIVNEYLHPEFSDEERRFVASTVDQTAASNPD